MDAEEKPEILSIHPELMSKEELLAAFAEVWIVLQFVISNAPSLFLHSNMMKFLYYRSHK